MSSLAQQATAAPALAARARAFGTGGGASDASARRPLVLSRGSARIAHAAPGVVRPAAASGNAPVVKPKKDAARKVQKGAVLQVPAERIRNFSIICLLYTSPSPRDS